MGHKPAADWRKRPWSLRLPSRAEASLCGDAGCRVEWSRTGRMRTIAILPVKSFGAAKQRLSEVLGSGSRQALAQAMCLDVLGALSRVESIEKTVVVTADHLAESLALMRGVHVLRDPVDAGLS